MADEGRELDCLGGLRVSVLTFCLVQEDDVVEDAVVKKSALRKVTVLCFRERSSAGMPGMPGMPGITREGELWLWESTASMAARKLA